MRTSSDPQWRVAAKAMGHWAPAPPITDESVRLDYRCKSLYGRASAKLLQVESSNSREHSKGVSVETAVWLAPKTNFRAAAPRAGVDRQPPPTRGTMPGQRRHRRRAGGDGCHIDFDSYFVTDQACPRTLLGMGITQIVLQQTTIGRVKRKAAVSDDDVAPR